MTSPKTKAQIKEYLRLPIPREMRNQIVQRSIPVPFFGNIERARVATISINPSFNEFVDGEEKLLIRPQKRFVDRAVLGVSDLDMLNEDQSELLYCSLLNYFQHNPFYDKWFKKLDNYVGDLLGTSYNTGTMVHLDVYPWATKKAWGKLQKLEGTLCERSLYSYKNSGLLREILLDKHFDYIYIDGATAKKQLQEVLDKTIFEREITVQGIDNKIYNFKMYEGTFNGTKLIGFNHTLNSSKKPNDVWEYLFSILSDRIDEKYNQQPLSEQMAYLDEGPEEDYNKIICTLCDKIIEINNRIDDSEDCLSRTEIKKIKEIRSLNLSKYDSDNARKKIDYLNSRKEDLLKKALNLDERNTSKNRGHLTKKEKQVTTCFIGEFISFFIICNLLDHSNWPFWQKIGLLIIWMLQALGIITIIAKKYCWKKLEWKKTQVLLLWVIAPFTTLYAILFYAMFSSNPAKIIGPLDMLCLSGILSILALISSVVILRKYSVQKIKNTENSDIITRSEDNTDLK